MSDILKLVLAFAEKWAPTAVLAVIFVVVAVRLFHWLYRERFDAQTGLLKLKDDTVAEVKRQADEIARDRERLRAETETQKTHIAYLKQKVERNAQTIGAVLGDALLFANHLQYALAVNQSFLLVSRRLAFVHRIARTYVVMEFTGAINGGPTPAEIDDRLERAASRIRRASEPFTTLTADYMKLTARLNLGAAYAASADIDALHAELEQLGDELWAQVRAVLEAERKRRGSIEGL